VTDIKNFKDKVIHFIGIGGSSMSGLAMLLKGMGYNVKGSDSEHSAKAEHLIEHGIDVTFPQSAKNVADADIGIVVYTAAIADDNPELVAARERGIPCMKRAELMGQIMRLHKSAVGISGTKGKTTTTALTATILMECDKYPTVLIGGTAKNIGSNMLEGKGDVLVAESCEYQDSFLSFAPTVAVILNVELEHTDYFKSMAQLEQSFVSFGELVPRNGGVVIGNADCEITRSIMSRIDRECLSYSVKDSSADYYGYDIVQNGEELCMKISYKGAQGVSFAVPIVGVHNAYNILAAVSASCACSGVSLEESARALKAYKGTGRRFDRYGMLNGAGVYDDYAHTPDEYRAVIDAARGVAKGKVRVVFQPHTYSRSIDFFDETVEAFKMADEVILVDIYAAREAYTDKIHSTHFVEEMKKRGYKAMYIPEYSDVTEYMKANAMDGDVILVIGAGHSYRLTQMIADAGTPTDCAHGD